MTDLRPARATTSKWLYRQLAERLPPERMAWLDARRQDVTVRPDSLGEIFPAVARNVGRDPIGDDWTLDEAARAGLLTTYAGEQRADDVGTALKDLYRYGDTAEKVAVLRSLAVRPLAGHLGDRAVPLLQDAIRTNDQRLLAAALGPYATEHLDDDAFRQAVLKCVFTGVPLVLVHGLPARADAELARMMTDFAAERTAAGRDVPPDIRPYLAQE